MIFGAVLANDALCFDAVQPRSEVATTLFDPGFFDLGFWRASGAELGPTKLYPSHVFGLANAG